MPSGDRGATVVLQSFRTRDVPAWIAACMGSVEAWAAGAGYRHERMDDAFFALAPVWARRRCAGNPYAVTDLARLAWMRRTLAKGASRVVWMDADVLMFRPARFALPDAGHGFAREHFLAVGDDGATSITEGVNNAVMTFMHGDPMLDRYWSAATSALRAMPEGPVPRTALGPALLERLDRAWPLTRIEGVGLYTWAILHDLAHGAGGLREEADAAMPAPPACANLCHFLRNLTPESGRAEFDRTCLEAVERLLAAP